MAVKKLFLYLVDAMIMLRSDHLPLKRFLQKTTVSTKVHNWGIKLSDYNIESKFINGLKNILADALSMLVNLELTDLNPPEKGGYEYGYVMSEPLPDMHVDNCKTYPYTSCRHLQH